MPSLVNRLLLNGFFELCLKVDNESVICLLECLTESLCGLCVSSWRHFSGVASPPTVQIVELYKNELIYAA